MTAAALTAAAITAWTYAGALHTYLLDDDFQWLAGAMQSGAARAFSVAGRTHFYRPVVELYFALFYGVAGCGAAALHLASVVVHGINAALVGAVAWRLTRTPSIAIIAAALFAAHQAPAQAVLWPSAISELLCVTFGLLMLHADLASGGERCILALGLGPLVVRQVPAAMRGVLTADGAGRLSDRGRGRRVDNTRDAGTRGSPDRGDRAIDVGPAHRLGIAHAQLVDAGHVVDDRAPVHRLGEHVLVDQLAEHDLGSERLQHAGAL
jgi:hypothetical protein